MAATANKSSADTARRVKDARQRHAGQSYGGGKRPYGYRARPGRSEQYHRKLLIVDAEAAIIEQAAADLLKHEGALTLKAIARDLRDRAARGEPGAATVTGAPWTPSTLRDVLLKPAVAGLTYDPATPRGLAADRALIDAPWPHILDPDLWKDLRDKLTDPARTTTPGNEPRWLVSKIARCACGSTVRVNGVARGRAAYVCDAGGHLKRAANKVDELVERRMIWRLTQPDADDPAPPAARAGHRGPGRAPRRAAGPAGKRRREQMHLHSTKVITAADLAAGMREIDELTAGVQARLAATRHTDPLKDFRDRPADVVWDALPVARKRAVIRLLADIEFAPVTPGGPKFNEDSVRVTWKVLRAAWSQVLGQRLGEQRQPLGHHLGHLDRRLPRRAPHDPHELHAHPGQLPHLEVAGHPASRRPRRRRGAWRPSEPGSCTSRPSGPSTRRPACTPRSRLSPGRCSR